MWFKVGVDRADNGQIAVTIYKTEEGKVTLPAVLEADFSSAGRAANEVGNAILSAFYKGGQVDLCPGSSLPMSLDR